MKDSTRQELKYPREEVRRALELHEHQDHPRLHHLNMEVLQLTHAMIAPYSDDEVSDDLDVRGVHHLNMEVLQLTHAMIAPWLQVHDPFT